MRQFTEELRAAEPFADAGSALRALPALLAAAGCGDWELRTSEDGRTLLCACGMPPLDQGRAALAHAVARLAATIEEADRRAEQATTAALTDPMTGLLNGRGWWQRVAQEAARSRRSEQVAAIGIVDLDRFKLVNDTQGHLAGDLLLRSVAHVLAGAIRTGDVLARLGGDEFGILAVDLASSAPRSLARRLRLALDAAQVDASVGVALLRPGDDPHVAFHAADLAMYRDKRRRRAGRPRAQPPSSSSRRS